MSLVKFVFATDTHGDMVNASAVEKLLTFVDSWKPKYRIHGGDGMDLRCYRKGASREEREDGISRDVQAHLHFLNQYKPHVFIEGNHDDRLREQSEYGSEEARSTEIARELQDTLDAYYRKKKMQVVKYSYVNGRKDYWQAPEGGYYFAHGKHHNMHAAKSNHETYEHPVICGHVHRFCSWQGRTGTSYTSPCLADIEKLRYDRHRPGKYKQSNGWVYGMINSKTGNSIAWTVVCDGGKWLSPEGEL